MRTIIGGEFNGIGMVIGGNVTLTSEFTGDLQLIGVGYVGNENDIAKFSAGGGFDLPNFASEDQVAEFRDAFDTYLCSSYNQLWVTEDTCTATLDADGVLTISILTGGPGSLTATCFASVSLDTMSAAEEVVVDSEFIASGYVTVGLKVWGTGTAYLNSLECSGRTCSRFFIALMEADTVFAVNAPFDLVTLSLPIYAPVARSVNIDFVDAEIFQAAVATARGSTLTFTGSFERTGNLASDFLWALDPLTSSVVVSCDCACDPNELPTEKETKQCLKLKNQHEYR
eukprot:Selendium_serpulae@DN6501_c2_g2_i1.p1